MTGTTRALIALERRAEDAWQTAKEHPTPAGLNYASGLTRAMETLAEEIPWPATSALNTVTDLLCDLRHYLDRHPEYGTFAAAVDQSQTHYDAETGGEE